MLRKVGNAWTVSLIYRRAPKSTWFQSLGSPVRGSGFDPPPQRSPAARTARPNAFRASRGAVLVLQVESWTSAPVAGFVLWVESWSSAAGRPAAFNAACSLRVRNPLMIETGNGSIEATTSSRAARVGVIDHVLASGAYAPPGRRSCGITELQEGTFRSGRTKRSLTF